MSVRGGHATARIGAGLLLAFTCAAAPTLLLAPPATGEVTECAEKAPSAFAPSIELGKKVTVSGECFTPREAGTIEIFIEENTASRAINDVNANSDGSITSTFEPEVAGDYTAVIKVAGKSASTTFTVTEATPTQEPTPTPTPTSPPATPTEEPTEPPAEEPTTDPTDPPVEPTEEPTPPATTDPATGDPTPTAPVTTAPEETDDPTTSAPAEETTGTEKPSAAAPISDDSGGSGGSGDSGSSGGSNDAQADADEDLPPSLSTNPFPSADDEAAPSAASGPTAPAESGPAASATDDFPAAAPEYTEEQRRTAALAVLVISLFAHGVSEGEVGISPAEAGPADEGDAEASEGADGAAGGGPGGSGSEELAETGAEVMVPAGLAGFALISGAGLLWYHARRRD